MVKLMAIGAALAVCGLALAAMASRGGEELKPGDPAPDFSLPGSDGKAHTLAGLRGRTVVLAWFPKAFTGG